MPFPYCGLGQTIDGVQNIRTNKQLGESFQACEALIGLFIGRD